MKAQLKDQVSNTTRDVKVRSAAAKPTEPPVSELAQAYMDLKIEAERIEMQMAKIKGTLTKEMPKLPGSQVLVRAIEDGNEVERFLYLCPSESKSFDLESAREGLSPVLFKELRPYIKIEETFKVKIAEELNFDFSKFEKYVTVRKSVSLRTKKVGIESDGE